MLVAADVLGLALAFLLTMYLAHEVGGGKASVLEEMFVFVAVLPVWVLAAKLYGLYDNDEERADHSTADDLLGVFNTMSVGTWVLVTLAILTGFAEVNLPKILFFWASAIVLVSTARAAARSICRRKAAYVQKTLIVGVGSEARLVARNIRLHPEYGLKVLGFVDTAPNGQDALDHVQILGPPEELPRLISHLGVDRVVFACSSDPTGPVLAALRACRSMPVQFDIVPSFYEMVGPGAAFHNLGGVPLIGLGPATLPRSSQLVKRTVDLVVSAVALVLLAPLLSIVALLVKLDSRGPVLFVQTRIGEGDRPFRMLKFRTMVADADVRKVDVAHLNHYVAAGGDTRMFKAPDDPRVTRVGRFLRRYSLDELPQLVNVLKGEMSMVGPRPLIVDEDRHVCDWARARLTVKPGMTGPWQVLGRNDIPFDEMMRLDYLYVTNWSLLRDIGLMLRTVPAVLRPRSCY
jgi:exopolysaccharide biosynthesis polyprenyl glycosylphosphotransferase